MMKATKQLIPIILFLFSFSGNSYSKNKKTIFFASCPSPNISSGPNSATRCPGLSVTFSVIATGTGTLSYQWRKNGSNIMGAINSAYTITSVLSSDAGSYDVVVTNNASGCTPRTKTSEDATLTVLNSPVITNNPNNTTKCAGTSASFSVTASGSGLSYQWRKDGNDISGAISPGYSITSVSASDAGTYDVVVSGSCGTPLFSSPAILTVNTQPVISTDPIGATLCSNQAFTFSVTASGTGLVYKWRKNGTGISGATGSTYTIADVASSNEGTYDVVVSGSCSPTDTSSTAILTVHTRPFIIRKPVNDTVCEGESAIFIVRASGTDITYQWRKNGIDISGATDDTLNINAVTSSDAGIYDVTVSGICTPSSVNTSDAMLVVNTFPVISCPGNISINNAIGSCDATVNFNANVIGNPLPAITYSKEPGTLFSIGTTTVTAQANNGCGNSSCQFNITIADSENPTISGIPSDIFKNSNIGTCVAIVNWTVPIANDNCSGVTLSSNHNAGDVFTMGTTIVTYTATDVSGNSVSANFNVIITDTQNPVIANLPSAITQANDIGACGATVNWTAPTANDNCSGVTLSSNHNPGDVFALGTTIVTYTATDASGNSMSANFNVIITDTQNPIITNLPSDISQSNDIGTCGAIVNWIAPTANDNCSGVALSSNHNAGDVFALGTTIVTYTATDASGNSVYASFNVIITDTQNPIITNRPSDISQSNDIGTCGAIVNWTAPTARDDCLGVTLSSNHNAGDVFALGTAIVTYTATDASGNSVSANFNVIITDTQNPIITNLPTDISQSNDIGTCGAIVNWTAPTANDNCLGVTLSSNHNAGDVFALGTTIVTYRATDASGNNTNTSFNVIITDTQHPIITKLPTDITQSNDIGNCSAIVNWISPTVNDNCLGVTLSSNHNAGDVFALGTTIVTYTATDASGNSANASFNVIITDTKNPEISGIPSNVIQNADSGQCSALVYWTEPIVSQSCSEVILTSDYQSGDTFQKGTTTVTYTASNAQGKKKMKSFNVTITGNENPIISEMPKNIIQSNDIGSCGGIVYWPVPIAKNNCSSLKLFTIHNSGDWFPIGLTTVTYTASDSLGNSVSADFTVTVQDNELPIALCKNITIPLDTTGNASIEVTNIDSGSNDNCSILPSFISKTTFNKSNLGDNIVTLTVNDSYNSASCNAIVTIVNNVIIPKDSVYEKSFTIYPNPVHKEFTMEISYNKSVTMEMKIFDVLGQMIYKKQFMASKGIIKKNILLENISSGIYLLEINTREEVITKKLIISN